MDSLRTLLLGLGARTVSYIAGIAADVAELKTSARVQQTSFDDEKSATSRRLDRLETACLTTAAKLRSIP